MVSSYLTAGKRLERCIGMIARIPEDAKFDQ